MSDQPVTEAQNLQAVLNEIREIRKDDERISIGEVLSAVGRRSFGPILLVAGLITVAPIVGDVPGVPTTMGIFVILVTAQILLRREYIWLPQWLLRRSVKRQRLLTALSYLDRPARWIDRFLRPRLGIFTSHYGEYFIALACLLIAAIMPLMEVVPFSANVAGAAFTAFGLSLIAKDDLLASLAFLFTFGTFYLVLYFLL